MPKISQARGERSDRLPIGVATKERMPIESSPAVTEGGSGQKKRETQRLKPPRSKPPGRLYSQFAGRVWGILSSSGEAVKQPLNKKERLESKMRERNLVIEIIEFKECFVFRERSVRDRLGANGSVRQTEVRCKPTNTPFAYFAL